MKLKIIILCSVIISYSVYSNEDNISNNYIKILGRDISKLNLKEDKEYYIIDKDSMLSIVNKDKYYRAKVNEMSEYINFLEGKLSFVLDSAGPYEELIASWKDKYEAEFRLSEYYQLKLSKEIKINNALRYSFTISLSIGLTAIGTSIVLGTLLYNRR